MMSAYKDEEAEQGPKPEPQPEPEPEPGPEPQPEPEEGWVIDGVTYLHRSVIDLSSLEMRASDDISDAGDYSPITGSLIVTTYPKTSACIQHTEVDLDGQHYFANALVRGSGSENESMLSTNFPGYPTMESQALEPVSVDADVSDGKILLPQCSAYYAQISEDGQTLTSYYNLREEPYVLINLTSEHNPNGVDFYHKTHFEIGDMLTAFAQSASSRDGYDAITGEQVELVGSEMPERLSIVLEKPSLAWEQGNPIVALLTTPLGKYYLSGNISDAEITELGYVKFDAWTYPDVAVDSISEVTQPYEAVLPECVAYNFMRNYGWITDAFNCLDVYYTLKTDPQPEESRQIPHIE